MPLLRGTHGWAHRLHTERKHTHTHKGTHKHGNCAHSALVAPTAGLRVRYNSHHGMPHWAQLGWKTQVDDKT